MDGRCGYGDGLSRRTVLRAAGAVVGIAAVAGGSRVAVAQDAGEERAYWPTEEWRVADPADVGMDPAALDLIDGRVAAETPLLSALLVVRGGEIVFEGYYNGFEVDETLHTWSVTKSVTSIATGIALREGVLRDLDQTLEELIPGRIPAGADPRVPGITVEHLLTSTAGWAWDSRTNFQRSLETDQLDVMMTRPMVCDPGVCFEYDSTCPNLLSLAIQEQTGETMAAYLQPRLFEPLGIAEPVWLTTAYGATRGGGGLELTPRDMAKLGFLYLNGGAWDGEEIVTPEWVAESTGARVDGTSALSGVNIGGGAYGYLWWAREAAGLPAYTANGYGGQRIDAVPDRDLIVVTGMATIVAERPEEQQNPVPIIEEVIVPAVVG